MNQRPLDDGSGASTDFQHEAVAPNGAVLLGFFSQAQSFRLRRKISGGQRWLPPKFKEPGTDFGGPSGSNESGESPSLAAHAITFLFLEIFARELHFGESNAGCVL
jgi:hypothetical protein